MRLYFKTQAVKFNFIQRSDTFFVEEEPLFYPVKRGRFTILKVKKKDISTWELLDKFSRLSNYKIGYAGLKDKNATTIQYFSIDSRDEKNFLNHNFKNIEILELFKSKYPLKIGDLKSNKFKIKLFNTDVDALKFALKKIEKTGFPNYFGYQRFGKEGNISKAKAYIEGEYFTKDRRLQKMLISIYQSYLFNRWLCFRIGLDRSSFKVLEGDILNNGIVTGLLPGRRVKRAFKKAGEIERMFDEFIPSKGYRRDAISYLKDVKIYEKNKEVILEFTLLKGAYATVFLEQLAQKEITYKGI